MPLAQVQVGQIVRRGPMWTVPGGFRRWAPAAGRVVRPQPAQPPSVYRQAPGYLWARHKILTARPFAYRAAMDRPFPDPGLRVTEATRRMLPAVHPWGRYTVPYPGRGKVRAFRFPDRPTLSEATGYYTASEEALGLGDPGFLKKVFKGVKKVVRKVVAPALRIAAPALSFIPGIGIPLAAAASITGQMLSKHKPLSIFRKPLRVFGEAAAVAVAGPALKTAYGWGVGMMGGKQILSLTGNVSPGEAQRAAIEAEYEIPPPMPATAWGQVAATVGQVATAAIPLASQLLQRQQPAPDPGAIYGTMDGGWGTPTVDPSGQGRYLPGPGPAQGTIVDGGGGWAGSPAEAGPVMAPEMVQPAGMFGGPMMMPLLIVGGVVALLAATR